MPAGSFAVMATEGPSAVSAEDLFAGSKVLFISVPGAFTPTCSMHHMPGIVKHARDFHARGIDTIACMAVNDVHVMHAWGESLGADGNVLMLADGNGDYTKALGLEFDGRRIGMGLRSQRFAIIVDDGVASYIAIEEPAKFEVTRAESLLAVL